MATEFTNIDFSFRHGTHNAVINAAIENGSFNVATDTGELYIDIAGVRVPILRDMFVYDTEAEIRALESPYFKRLYYANDTCKVMIYEEESLQWIIVCSPEIGSMLNELQDEIDSLHSFEIIILDSEDSLPDTGESNIIYFVPQENSDSDTVYDEYMWISSGSYYEKIGISKADLSDYYTKTESNTTFAPKSHASAETTYGVGNSTTYGHIKVSDIYNSQVSNGDASHGVAASQNALYNVYQAIGTSISQLDNVPTNHASVNTTYGIGTSSNYGHTKVSDTYNSQETDADASHGVAASQNALYGAYNTLNSAIGGLDNVPTNHASNYNTYGSGTSTDYGHVKLSDTYNSEVNNGAADNGLAASQNALYNAYHDLDQAIQTTAGTAAGAAPASHASSETTYGVGTSTLYGHVKLSDTYNSEVNNGAADNGLAASQNALYNAYHTLNNAINSFDIDEFDGGDEDEVVTPNP